MDVVVVFFVKHKTAYELRISDWSSDVCSSDLSAAIWRRRREAFRGPDRPARLHALAQQQARADRRLSETHPRSRPRLGTRRADRRARLSGRQGGDGARPARRTRRRGIVPPVAPFRRRHRPDRGPALAGKAPPLLRRGWGWAWRRSERREGKVV